MSFLNGLRRFFCLRKNLSRNLGLWGDLDDLEMLQDIERSFDVQFSEKDAVEIGNVGEFFDATAKKIEQNTRKLSWEEFTLVLEPHGNLAARCMTRETEFFRCD